MKKINLIAPILASGAVVASVVPMVSCNKTITVELKYQTAEQYYTCPVQDFKSKKNYCLTFTAQADMRGIELTAYDDQGGLSSVENVKIQYLKVNGVKADDAELDEDQTWKYWEHSVKKDEKVEIYFTINGGLTVSFRAIDAA